MVLNFLSPPKRDIDRNEHNSLSIFSSNAEMEFHMIETQQHALYQSLQSFIKGYRVTFNCLLSFLVNLIVNYGFYAKIHHEVSIMQLIMHLLMIITVIIIEHKIRQWYE